MGLTKQYLRYVPGPVFGLIESGIKGGVLCVPHMGKEVVGCANAENVVLWNMKTGEKIGFLSGEGGSPVTAIGHKGNLVAVGYANGDIKLFDLDSEESDLTFSGHKSPVLALQFDATGFRLASGSADTDIILWDVLNGNGLFRLKGHKGPVTGLRFFHSRSNLLVSASKDALIKFWDLDIRHCFKTFPAHLTEVWDLDLIKNDDYLITGSGDSELRVFKLTFLEDQMEISHIEPEFKKLKVVGKDDESGEEEEEEENEASNLKIEKLGSLLRSGRGRTYSLVTDDQRRIVASHGNDNTLEVFCICSEEEVRKRLLKKVKKVKKKKREAGDESLDTSEDSKPTVQEEFRRLKTLKAGGKIRSVYLQSSPGNKVKIIIGTANNLIESWSLDYTNKGTDPIKVRSFGSQGHRSDVRTIAFSGDNTAIASVSHETIKIWSRSTQTCIRSMESGYGLCATFVVGDRQVIVGTKKGSLQLFDLNSALMTEEIENAHDGEIWSICQTPSKDSFVTGSADKSVKFWALEFVEKQGEPGKILSLVHIKTLQLDQDVLSVKLSPDGRLVALALLDTKIKVFFTDSFKLLHDLFGHKLPVLSIDICHDSSILVSASADRNVKIWDLTHGQCEKSIFAHDDSITAVQFIPSTHMFFTASKDGTVKQWDADKFLRILTLEGHRGEIWNLSISPNGNHVVTSGHDKTLRLWERTQEPLVLEDERETEREKEAGKVLAVEDSYRPDAKNEETALPTKRTAVSELSAERLMEAIDLYQEYCKERQDTVKKSGDKGLELPQVMALMYPGVFTAEDFMFLTLAKVKSAVLEETLLVLPLDFVVRLLDILEQLLQKPSVYIEILSRVFFFLIEIHFGPLSSSAGIKPMIARIHSLLNNRLRNVEESMGFNVAALTFMQNRAEEKKEVQIFMEATNKLKKKRTKKKKIEKALQTAIMAV